MQLANSGALLPQILRRDFSASTLWMEAAVVLGGVMLVSALAQIAVQLPWTPVPITGQTFGVTLMALLWGRKRAMAVIVSYLALGACGAPVFAGGLSGLTVGPTMGYLFGMILSSAVVGELADRGFARNWGTAFFAAVVGSFFVLGSGLVVLSFFLPAQSGLLVAGLWPFLPGDIIKNSLASFIASRAYKISSAGL